MTIRHTRHVHAAHDYLTGAPLHDLEQWDVPAPEDVPPHRPPGVPAGAEYHSGYLAADGSRRRLYVLRSPPSVDAPNCATCARGGGVIVLVSNGQTHSSHRLYFVQAPSVDAVQAVLHPEDPAEIYENGLNPSARVVGTCEALRWQGEPYRGGTMTLAKFTEEAASGVL